MATFYSYGVDTNMNTLWPASGGANVSTVLIASAGEYRIQLSDGTQISYSGSFTYSMGPNGYLVPAGTYFEINLYDVQDNSIGTLTDILNADASLIFSAPAATILADADTISINSSTSVVQTLVGQGGADTFLWDGNGWTGSSPHAMAAGSSINGGTGTDIIALIGQGRNFDLRNTVLSGIEEIRLHLTTGDTSSQVVQLTAQQVIDLNNGNPTGDLVFTGDGNHADLINISNTTGATSVDLSTLTFNNIGNASFYYSGSATTAETVTGPNMFTEFRVQTNDTVNGGDQGNNFTFLASSQVAGNGSINGGGGTDSITIASNAAIDLAAVSSIEEIRLSQAASLTLNGQASGFGLSSTASLNGNFNPSTIESLNFRMAQATTLNLAGFVFGSNWGAEDRIIITGDADAETITGSNRNETFITGGGADVFSGGGGDDTVRVSGTTNAGASLDGGTNSTAGDTLSFADLVFVSGAANSGVFMVLGEGAAAATFSGSYSNPAVAGLVATNFENVTGTQFSDAFVGNSGNNTLIGLDGYDQFRGGGGTDFIDGGDGRDAAYYDDHPDSIVVTLNGSTQSTVYVNGVASDVLVNIEEIWGGAGNDTITGDANINYLQGKAGDDIISGGAGDDWILGQGGNDTLNGDTGWDRLYGLAGDDTYTVDDTSDIAQDEWTDGTGEGGDDLVNVVGTTGTYSLTTYIERMTLLGTGNTNATGNALNNTLTGNSGNNIFIGGAGGDNINGGGGADTASYATSGAAVQVNLTTAGVQTSTGDASGDTLSSIENLIGSTLGDNLIGSAGDNVINGNGGNDFINALGGNDTIVFNTSLLAANVQGGSGTDTLLINGGAVPTSFNLVTAGIEQAKWVGSNATSTTTDIYNTAWQKLSSSVVNNTTGTRIDTTFDVAGTQNYSSIRNDYNASNQNTFNRTIYDAGASAGKTIDTYYDVAGAQNYSTQRTDTRTSDGAVLYSNIVYDAGASAGKTIETYYDVAGTQNYISQRTDKRTSDGAVSFTKVVYDAGPGAGKTIETYFDIAGTQNYVSQRTDMRTSDGAVSYTKVVYDAGPGAGKTIDTYFDIAGTQDYSSQRTDKRTSDGATLFTRIVYDAGPGAGKTIDTTFDVDGLQNYSSTRTDVRTSDNAVMFTRTYYDTGPSAGTRWDVTYDADNLQTWNQHVQIYNSTGTLISDYFV